MERPAGRAVVSQTPLLPVARAVARTGGTAGLLTSVLGLALLGLAPSAYSLFDAAIAFGVMIGTVTPLAFAHLAVSAPESRMGRTLGSAELGRELGDAGGPFLVGAAATVWALPAALALLAGATLAASFVSWTTLRAPATIPRSSA